MPQALLRWHSLAEKESERKSIVFTNFTFLGFIFIATIFLILPFRASISNLIFNSPQYGIFIIYVLISITFANLARIAQSLLRIEEKSMLYALSVIAQFSASLILNIYFVAFLKLGVKGILIANIISQALLFTILFPYLIKRMEFRIDFQKLREMLGFSYPFIFIALSTTILSLGDRLMLEKLSSRAQVGLYSLGYKISNVLKILIVDAFTSSVDGIVLPPANAGSGIVHLFLQVEIIYIHRMGIDAIGHLEGQFQHVGFGCLLDDGLSFNDFFLFGNRFFQ